MVKLQEVIDSQKALGALLDTKLPIKVSYKISRLVNKMQPDLKLYDEKRNAIVRELGTEEAGTWTINPENIEEYSKQLQELLSVELDLGFAEGKDLEKIKISELGDISVEPRELLQLNWLLAE